jgi:hypothetical protein
MGFLVINLPVMNAMAAHITIPISIKIATRYLEMPRLANKRIARQSLP